MFLQVFTGNLVSDATFRNVSEERSVINFTVAVNFSTGKKDESGNYIDEVNYFRCAKWVKGKETPKLMEYLKKGKKVLVHSDQLELKSSVKEETQETFTTIQVNVSHLELC